MLLFVRLLAAKPPVEPAHHEGEDCGDRCEKSCTATGFEL